MPIRVFGKSATASGGLKRNGIFRNTNTAIQKLIVVRAPTISALPITAFGLLGCATPPDGRTIY